MGTVRHEGRHEGRHAAPGPVPLRWRRGRVRAVAAGALALVVLIGWAATGTDPVSATLTALTGPPDDVAAAQAPGQDEDAVAVRPDPGGDADGATGAPGGDDAQVGGAAPTAGPGASDAGPADQAGAGQDPGASPSVGAAPTAPPPSPDQVAGVLARDVPQVGTGQLGVVPGAASAPGQGRTWTVRVLVEGGLPADGAAVADFALATLNDPRGWGREGHTFARTDGDADIDLVLASPDTSERMCRPLRTNGTLSCRVGPRVVLTWYRWVHGQEDFGGDLTLYRQYLVNHEVGHALGHGHLGCPGADQLAPVMMQQTKGVHPCVPNAWPYP
ncbi:DUF3152 domain-containing protein [Thalassiella azotivora]